MPLTKFFRVVTEGATCDGRNVSYQDIIDMADQYDPKLYASRVNIEHLRGLSPSSEFRAYGDIVAARTAKITEGPLKGKLSLEVQVDATDELVALKNGRQKIFHSIEFHPSFADTGRAYLMGLACTDSPASLGSEMMKFCAGQTVNPLAGRKHDPACLFTEAIESDFEFEDESEITTAGTGNGRKFFSAIMEMLSTTSRNAGRETSEIRQAVELIAGHQRDAMDEIETLSTRLQSAEEISTEVTALRQELSEITTALSKLDAGGARRQESPGNSGRPTAQLTDC